MIAQSITGVPSNVAHGLASVLHVSPERRQQVAAALKGLS